MKDDRLITPLSSEIRFLNLNEDPPAPESRKRKVDPVDQLVDSRLFTKMKINEEEREINNTPLKIRVEENPVEQEGNEEAERELFEEDDEADKNITDEKTYREIHLRYRKMNNYLKELTFERISRNSK